MCCCMIELGHPRSMLLQSIRVFKSKKIDVCSKIDVVWLFEFKKIDIYGDPYWQLSDPHESTTSTN